MKKRTVKRAILYFKLEIIYFTVLLMIGAYMLADSYIKNGSDYLISTAICAASIIFIFVCLMKIVKSELKNIVYLANKEDNKDEER